jgi:hypothetical protein
VAIAERSGVSQLVIGLTIAAVGTRMRELATSVGVSAGFASSDARPRGALVFRQVNRPADWGGDDRDVCGLYHDIVSVRLQPSKLVVTPTLNSVLRDLLISPSLQSVSFDHSWETAPKTVKWLVKA